MDLSKEQLVTLVEGCIGNERSAQENLYRMFYAQMLRICYRYLNAMDPSYEALNEGFLKVFQNIKSFDPQKGDLGGWICTIMIRTAIDYRRKELKFSLTEPFNDHDTDEYFIDPNILHKLYAEDLLKNIWLLPDATRVVFNLSVIDGYTHKEIGEQLKITESTSRWHLTEAKKRLRKLLQTPDENPGELNNNNKAK